MKYRRLGNTGITVSEIGFGAWGIGGLSNGATSYGKTDDDVSRRALARAFEQGITLFDTSDLYGYGHSETLLGETFAGERKKIVIASKVGFLEHNGPQDFSSGHIRRSVEASMKRLRTDYIDLYQLHSPSIDTLDDGSVAKTLSELKKEGKIRAYGISARSPEDALKAVEEYGFDSVQVNFNLVDQRADDSGLFKRCGEKGVGLICRTPLCFGFLTGAYSKETKFDTTDHRSTWSPEQRERWATAYRLFVDSVSREGKQSNVQVALRFCLSYPSVSTVIPGMLNEAEVDENVGASSLALFSDKEMSEFKNIYRENTFFLGK